jgi:hypothetical protein
MSGVSKDNGHRDVLKPQGIAASWRMLFIASPRFLIVSLIELVVNGCL